MSVPFWSAPQLKLRINDSVQSRTDISHKTRYQGLFGSTSTSSTTVFYVVGQIDDHDHKQRQAAAREKRRRMRPQRSAASLQQNAAAEERVRSSFLPQAEWSRNTDSSNAHPPATAERSSQAHLMPSPPESLFAWRQRLPSPGSPAEPRRTSRSTAGPATAQRKRPNNIAVREPTMDDVSNVALLYPQMSPYADPTTLHRSYETPTPIQRSISQPQSPTWRHSPVSPMTAVDLPSIGFERSPTYPPSLSRRYTRSVAPSQDAAFHDPRELQMFAEASVGLGPNDDFCSPVQERMGGRSRQSVRQSTRSDTLQTPTTVEAFQHLASMPGGNIQQQRQRLGTSPSGLDLWLTPPPAIGSTAQQSLAMPDVSPIEEHSGDDELPDYVTSQAQAAAQHRQAATLRAQELQRRWRASTTAP